ncbi:MAG: hypothetical protein QMC77_06795 [Methanocellales archaeon]|nr:hypothetical protein [Methanocellales archaeon]
MERPISKDGSELQRIATFFGINIEEAKSAFQILEENKVFSKQLFIICKTCKHRPVVQIVGELEEVPNLNCPGCGSPLEKDNVDEFYSLASEFRKIGPNIWLEAAVYKAFKEHECSKYWTGLKIDGQDIDIAAVTLGKVVFCECKDRPLKEEDIGRVLMRLRNFEFVDYYFLVTSQPVTLDLEVIPDTEKDKIFIIQNSPADAISKEVIEKLDKLEQQTVSEIIKEKFVPFVHRINESISRMPYEYYLEEFLEHLE